MDNISIRNIIKEFYFSKGFKQYDSKGKSPFSYYKNSELLYLDIEELKLCVFISDSILNNAIIVGRFFHFDEIKRKVDKFFPIYDMNDTFYKNLNLFDVKKVKEDYVKEMVEKKFNLDIKPVIDKGILYVLEDKILIGDLKGFFDSGCINITPYEYLTKLRKEYIEKGLIKK